MYVDPKPEAREGSGSSVPNNSSTVAKMTLQATPRNSSFIGTRQRSDYLSRVLYLDGLRLVQLLGSKMTSHASDEAGASYRADPSWPSSGPVYRYCSFNRFILKPSPSAFTFALSTPKSKQRFQSRKPWLARMKPRLQDQRTMYTRTKRKQKRTQQAHRMASTDILLGSVSTD